MFAVDALEKSGGSYGVCLSRLRRAAQERKRPESRISLTCAMDDYDKFISRKLTQIWKATTSLHGPHHETLCGRRLDS